MALEQSELSVGSDHWTVGITGTVGTTRQYTPGELLSLPLETYAGRFGCADRPATERHTWRGVPVDRLLSRVDPSPAAEHALVTAVDGDFACALGLERLRECLLAVGLDGGPLPFDRGGPVRLIPTTGDHDCWETVKWVTEIELAESEPTGATAEYRSVSEG